MRKLLVLVAVNVLLVAFVNTSSSVEETTPTPTPKKCQEDCASEDGIVCAYDGNCYREYRNKCDYDMEKCSRKNNLETVDISLCELAAKDNHPNFKICAE